MALTVEPAIPILDGHNDTVLKLYLAEHGDGEGRTFFARGSAGHIDLPRARAGGLAGGFCAVFVPPGSVATGVVTIAEVDYDVDIVEGGYAVRPAPPLDPEYARRATLALVARLYRLEEQSAGQVRVVRTVDELTIALRDGAFAAILHFEGAEAIAPDLDALEVFYRAGLRSLGPVWSRPNAFGHGVPFRYPASPDTGPGLTDAGRALVRACNRLGILIDLSHLNERG
ncbi:MAG: dipeptidase, partial [Chloroflexota bacterium]|nr:dipeptidase [Chloroflexota bacterium]